jgi:hypothetical protein
MISFEDWKFQMNDLDLSPDFYIEWSANQDFSSGKIFHIKRNKSGGSINNEVALFFITKQESQPKASSPTNDSTAL